MDHHLGNALGVLRKAGAQNLPSANDVEKVETGVWTGVSVNPKTKEQHHWSLTKNGPESYNVYC